VAGPFNREAGCCCAAHPGAGKTRLIETLVGLRQDAPQELAVAGYDPRALGLAALRPIFALAARMRR
jgi:ATP-binding cassette subfamily C protein CydC